MDPDNPRYKALREALELSPENVPLRRHFAEFLLSVGENVEAEKEFREALRRDPQSFPTMIGLAAAFHAQGKNDLALNIIEDQVLRHITISPAAHVLHARLLLAAGKLREAVEAYRIGVDQNPSHADRTLEAQLRNAVPSTGPDPLPAEEERFPEEEFVAPPPPSGAPAPAAGRRA